MDNIEREGCAMTLASNQPMNTGTTHAAVVVDTRLSPFCRLRPLSLDAVTIDDAFWAPRRRVNQAVTLIEQYEQLEQTGRLHNLRRAAGQEQGAFEGRFFNDSDVYKWLEAAAWVLSTERDEWLQTRVDDLIALIAAAQDADGYLDTYFTFDRRAARWTNLAAMHELYCAGHLIQGAVAHHRATGAHTLLDVAIRLADHIVATFNPERLQGTPRSRWRWSNWRATPATSATCGRPRSSSTSGGSIRLRSAARSTIRITRPSARNARWSATPSARCTSTPG